MHWIEYVQYKQLKYYRWALISFVMRSLLTGRPKQSSSRSLPAHTSIRRLSRAFQVDRFKSAKLQMALVMDLTRGQGLYVLEELKWNVTSPELSTLESTAHLFSIELWAQMYHATQTSPVATAPHWDCTSPAVWLHKQRAKESQTEWKNKRKQTWTARWRFVCDTDSRESPCVYFPK